jgi:hypothetical protein
MSSFAYREVFFSGRANSFWYVFSLAQPFRAGKEASEEVRVGPLGPLLPLPHAAEGLKPQNHSCSLPLSPALKGWANEKDIPYQNRRRHPFFCFDHFQVAFPPSRRLV